MKNLPPWAGSRHAAEKTCATCGKPYYGVGCPSCDYPPVPPDKNLAKQRLSGGLIAILAGLYPIGLYFFQPKSHQLVILVVGLAFVSAGIQLVSVQRFYDENGWASVLVSCLFLASFAFVCFYGAFSPRAHWSGPPLVPNPLSQLMARTGSGFIGFAFSAWLLKVLYLAIKSKGKK
jgi:hypothetical protein